MQWDAVLILNALCVIEGSCEWEEALSPKFSNLLRFSLAGSCVIAEARSLLPTRAMFSAQPLSQLSLAVLSTSTCFYARESLLHSFKVCSSILLNQPSRAKIPHSGYFLPPNLITHPLNSVSSPSPVLLLRSSRKSTSNSVEHDTEPIIISHQDGGRNKALRRPLRLFLGFPR